MFNGNYQSERSRYGNGQKLSKGTNAVPCYQLLSVYHNIQEYIKCYAISAYHNIQGQL